MANNNNNNNRRKKKKTAAETAEQQPPPMDPLTHQRRYQNKYISRSESENKNEK